jgi:hypothetical protein
MLRSGNTNLPDTIYTYWEEEKNLYSIGAITYDDKGRIIQEKGRRDTNGDGIINENDGEYKVEYTYTQKGDVLETQEVRSVQKDGLWINTSKVVGTQKSPDIQLDYLMYDYIDDGWFLWSKTVAAKYNEKGLPIMYHDTTFMENGFDSSRMDLTYNENDMCDTMVIFIPSAALVIGYEWIPSQKMELNYNENNSRKKDAYFEYDIVDEEWYFTFSVEYTYDDKGNLSSMKEIDNDGEIIDSEYYTNIYSSSVANEEIFTVESSIYPNPVSDVLNVTINGTSEAIVTLVSVNGSIVIQQKVQQSTVTIPVSSLAKGYYFLTVQTAQGTKTHKVIIK